ncbi:MAG: leucyl aminopeptidase [Planctomycetes bacterium]|nr:leucyl aminopeptidase [Planctomycetota bacterium]
MRITPAVEDLAEHEADTLVIGIPDDPAWPGPSRRVDALSRGLLGRLFESRDVAGKVGETTLVLEPPGLRAKALLTVGLGKQAALDRGVANRAAGSAARQLARRRRGRVAFALGDDWPEDRVAGAICGAMVGCAGQDLFRAEKKSFSFDEMTWFGATAEACEQGRILGESVNLARRLVNQPPNVLFPDSFADIARTVCAEHGIECEVWDDRRLEQERCGAMLAVGRASTQPPRMLILRYRGAPGEMPPVALVGKGVTFDSGGLSIKPSDGMKTMKGDMAGAAAVLAAMCAAARRGFPAHLIGVLGLVENVISGSAYKLGDVLTARSGTTIEVLNTDAEGRLVLADALNVAVELGAAAIIDVATLTGACSVALGQHVVGVMTNHQPWCDRVLSAARECGEPAWQLPMFPDYGELIRSQVADIKNVGDGRYAGTITGAKFLEEFVGGRPWVHADIAGSAFSESARAWIDGGGTGVFVRTLIEVVRNWSGAAPA